MTAKTTSKTASKTAATQDPNAISAARLADIVAVAGKTEQGEITLLHAFASDMESGVLSVRGFRATLAAAAEQGSALAYMKAGQAEFVVTMSHILNMTGAPQSIAQAYTLADKAMRSAKKVKGSSKADFARAEAKAAKDHKTYAGKVARRKVAEPTKRAPRTPDTTPTTGAVDIAKIAAELTAWIRSASDDDMTAKVQSALEGLGVAIETRLAEYAD